jgi:hypothetical protein
MKQATYEQRKIQKKFVTFSQLQDFYLMNKITDHVCVFFMQVASHNHGVRVAGTRAQGEQC